MQRLIGLQCLLLGSLSGVVTLFAHRRPNPSVKRTANSGRHWAVSGEAVPLLSAAYLKR